MNTQTMKKLNRLCFGISVLSLAAAVVCSPLRRLFEVELPPVVTVWLIPVFTAAAVGYLTNWLAIQLLFRPYEPVKWLGGLQGMIPKRQQDLADTLAREIPANLMPSDRIVFQIRRKIRETMQAPELAERLHAMVAEYIRDEHRKRDLTRRIAEILDVAGAAGLESGLTPSNIRKFYHAYGSGLVKEKTVCSKAFRAKILNELNGQVPGLIGVIRANMPALFAEYMRDNPVRGAVLSVFTGTSGENLPWRRLEQAIRDKLSGRDADAQAQRTLAEFASRLEGYLASPEFETDVAGLKQDAMIGDALDALRDNLAEKMLEFLEDELVWQVVRDQILPGIRVFLQVQISRNKDALIAGLDLSGRIRESILGLNPETVYKLVDKVSGEELGMLQLLGFVLGGLAGFLLVFTQ